jgi:AhpD family alkylhydroperoxidase
MSVAHYHDPSDRKFDRNTRLGAPKANAAFIALNQATFDPEGAIPLKYRELMALSVALLTQCDYCIEAHANNSRTQGATREEIAETIMLAGTMRASASIAHGRLAWKFFLAEQD